MAWQRKCVHCGKAFSIEPLQAAAKYCSDACMVAARKQRRKVLGVTRICEQCGKEFYAQPYRETTARFCSKSCQGLAIPAEELARRATTHGYSRQGGNNEGTRKWSAEYRAWLNMKRRCEHGRFYVENGIEVCERWANSFPAFLEDMGPKPSSKHSLDRYPNRFGNYELGNCRWATRKEQGWSKIGQSQTAEARRKKAEAVYRTLSNNENAKQKLTVTDIQAIRMLEGEIPRSFIAQHYGINVWHVRDIQKRRVWAWVEDEQSP